MYLEEKIKFINEKLQLINNLDHIVIWGAGVHSKELFEKTDILKYGKFDLVDSDEGKYGKPFWGMMIQKTADINWQKIEAVVISAAPRFQEEIKASLKNNTCFQGEVITFYKETEKLPFYVLQSENDTVKYDKTYDSWEEAESECQGYSEKNILDKVCEATRKVVSGEAEYEMDSVCFYHKNYFYPLCTLLLTIALKKQNETVTVLDIGGSLGNVYYQNKDILEQIQWLSWNIFEQDHYVKAGKTYVENEVIHFYESDKSYSSLGKIDVALLSSSLNWIKDYKEVIQRIMDAEPQYILFDKIIIGKTKKICRQIVSEPIYNASYPVYIFDTEEIMDMLSDKYICLENSPASIPVKVAIDNEIVEYRYYLFQKREI